MNIKQNKKTKSARRIIFGKFEISVIVITILIIIFATIPPIIKRQIDSVNRIKLTKLIKSYNDMMQNMALDSGIISNEALKEISKKNKNSDCSYILQYIEVKKRKGCIIETIDGIWWDFSDLTSPIVSFKESGVNPSAAISDKNYNSFYLLIFYDNRIDSFRMNDVIYEKYYGDESRVSRAEKVNKFLYNR